MFQNLRLLFSASNCIIHATTPLATAAVFLVNSKKIVPVHNKNNYNKQISDYYRIGGINFDMVEYVKIEEKL